MHILIVTSEWPTQDHPEWVPFIIQQVDSLRAAGLQVDVFPFRGAGKPANYLKSWYRLRQDFDFSRYDLLHAHFGQSGLLCLPKRLPLVVTLHGSDLHGIVKPDGNYALSGLILRKVSRFIARQADQVIVVAEHLIKYLPKNITPQVIPGGVDLELFRPQDKSVARQQLGLPHKKLLVLFPANPHNPIKRYQLAIEAVNHLKSELDLELLVVQGIPHAKMPLYLNACDALLLTSHHEGSPTVVKEALACNLPVVSVDVGDVRSLISGLPACALCESDAPDAIAAGLRISLEYPSRPQLRPAVTHLAESQVAGRVIQVYQRALSA